MNAYQYAILGLLSFTSGENDIENFNIEKYKVYEYEAPEGMRPEDLIKCFQKINPNIDPTIDSIHFPARPYLPEDMGEFFLHQQIQNSKYVSTKEEADIFVVNTMPILSKYIGDCNGWKNHSERLQKWVEIIKESEFFQSRPEDHYFICQSWTCFRAVTGELADLANQMTYLIHEANRFWISGNYDTNPKDVIVVPYVAHSDIYPLSKKAWKDRKYEVSFIGTLGRRTWVRKILNLPSVQEKSFLYVVDSNNFGAVRSFDDYVKYMTNSQYCLVLAGDSPSSRRLFDAIISGCIPILIGPEYTMPFEKLIPYEKISIRINLDDWRDHPEEQLDNINKISLEEGFNMYNEMQKYVKYVNWRHGSGVLEAILNDINLKRNNVTEPAKWYDGHFV